MRILYPGSFDPLTFGHLDLIERGSVLFGEVVVAVLRNSQKDASFSLKERLRHITLSTSHLKGIEVISYEGLTVDCAQANDIALVLRGLRAMSDFEYELQIAHTNSSLSKEVQTIFLATSAKHSFLSSSVVKEVARYGGNVDHMVPKPVATDLYQLFKTKLEE